MFNFRASIIQFWLNSAVMLFLVSLSSYGHASEIVYTPTNPTFGGSPLNGSFLLGKAQSQNDHKENSSGRTGVDPLSRFEESLQRNILNQIAREVAGRAFGEDGLGDGGVFETGQFSIEVITTNPDAIGVRITNNETGEVTTIDIPIFS